MEAGNEGGSQLKTENSKCNVPLLAQNQITKFSIIRFGFKIWSLNFTFCYHRRSPALEA
jgi:hypothetical protein